MIVPTLTGFSMRIRPPELFPLSSISSEAFIAFTASSRALPRRGNDYFMNFLRTYMKCSNKDVCKMSTAPNWDEFFPMWSSMWNIRVNTLKFSTLWNSFFPKSLSEHIQLRKPFENIACHFGFCAWLPIDNICVQHVNFSKAWVIFAAYHRLQKCSSNKWKNRISCAMGFPSRIPFTPMQVKTFVQFRRFLRGWIAYFNPGAENAFWSAKRK